MSQRQQGEHVPVAIELVIDIATDIDKSGHAGQVLRLGDTEKYHVSKWTEMHDSCATIGCYTRATTLAQLSCHSRPHKAEQPLPCIRSRYEGNA